MTYILNFTIVVSVEVFFLQTFQPNWILALELKAESNECFDGREIWPCSVDLGAPPTYDVHTRGGGGRAACGGSEKADKVREVA